MPKRGKARSQKPLRMRRKTRQTSGRKRRRQSKLLAEEKNVEQKVRQVEQEERSIGQEEAKIEREEHKIEQETEKVEKLQHEIKHEVMSQPLKKFNIKDVNKGIIGAFIGVVAHFAFIYSKEVSKDISVVKATVIILFSYFLIVILMYETGYRDIIEKKILGILPTRATVIFGTSLLVVLMIFFLFNQINLDDPVGLYKQIAVTSVLASLGAGTADLIGRH